MAQSDLIPMNERTEEEQKKIARQGGIASGEARRRKKTLREIAEAFGSQQAPVAVIKKMQDQGILYDGDITNDVAVIVAQYGKAEGGSTRAATYLAEIKGERIQRVEQINIDQSLEELNGYFDRQEATSEGPAAE